MDSFPVAPRGYKLVRFLGSGGTANVYLALRQSDNRQVALKFPLNKSPETRCTFETLIRREFELVNRLGYPGLIRIYEMHDNPDQEPFLAMEYCAGKTLDNVGQIKDARKLVNVISSISINLYYLQLVGLHHGDLKPQNIFIPDSPAAFTGKQLSYTKISDFSLALRSDEDITARLGVGTVGYIAPETIEYNQLTYKSDLFALGIIAYSLATGKHPFYDNESDPVRINSMIKEHDPEPPDKLNRKMPDGLSQIILEMLAKNPESRPENGFQICQRLEKIGADYPYKKAIRPKHILQQSEIESSFAVLNETPFRVDEGAQRLLGNYAGADRNWLRNILEINFSGNHIYWKDGYLAFRGKPGNIIWPRRMQEWVNMAFQALSFSQKRRAVSASVVGEMQDAKRIGIIDGTPDEEYLNRPLIYLIRRNLSEATVKRISNRLARTALNDRDNIKIVARLFLQANNLDEGYTVTLDAVSELINENDYRLALEMLDNLERICRLKNDFERLKFVLMKQGDTYKQMGDSANAERNYLRIVELYQDCPHDRLLGETFKDLGDLYKSKQDYKAGISALEKAEKIYSEIGDELELSHTLNNLGNIYSVNNQFEKSSAYFRRALRMQKRLGAIKDTASTLNNIGVQYYKSGRWDRVIRILKLSLILNKEISNSVEIGRVLNNMGSVYFEIGSLDEALRCLKESLEINKKIGNQKELLFNYENLTQVMLAAGTLKEAVKYLKEGLTISSEIADLPHHTNFTGNMAIVLKRMGYYGKAAQSIKQAIEAGEKLDDRRDLLLWHMTLADLHFRLNQKDKAIAELHLAQDIAEETSDKRAQLSIYSQMGFIQNNMALIEKAEGLSREMKSVRMTAIVNLKRSLLLLRNNRHADALEILLGLNKEFRENKPDIEASGYFNCLGGCYLGMKDISEAAKCFETGLRIAEKGSLLPEMIEATTNLGKIHTELKDYEVAYNYYRNGIKNLKTMVADIDEKSDRLSFLSDGKIASLTSEIDKLKRMLSQKGKAGR